MGTRLQALAGTTQACIDSLNLDPNLSEIVSLVHRSYVEAGADVLFTNTYGANAVKLGRYGRAAQVESINQEGVRLARRAAQQQILGGSVGPLEIYSLRDDYTPEQLQQIFHQQMAALVEAGVDWLVLETFQDLQEAEMALKAAQAFGKPILFSVGGVQGGRTGTGAQVKDFALLAQRLGASMLGANCRGPYDILETLHLLGQHSSLPLFALPNAGYPEIDRGRVIYNIDSQEFGRCALQLAQAGACLIGGCCGTDPSHIRELARVLRGLPLSPPPRTPLVQVQAPAKVEPPPASDNRITQIFETTKTLISVELRPGRTTPFEEFLESGRYLAGCGVHLFDVPDNAGAKVSLDPLWAASRLQAETGVPTLIHLSTSHRNLVATQSYLLGAWQAGIQGVLAVTGDHPNVGDHDKYASRVNDIKSSVNLMGLIGMLNRGRLFNDTASLPSNFAIGGGFNPVRGLTAQVKWLQRKIEAGAQFIYTQPVYREEDVERMLEATQDFKIPILVGIMPLVSRRNAEFFAAGRIPGVIIPAEILARYQSIDDPQEGRKVGLEMALELMRRVRSKVRGFYILPPFGRDHHTLVGELLGLLGSGENTMALEHK